ncbi:hypothetical protein [Nocardia rosealba]|uniref:hypothetical protein n=1 Tax=Nocardia rosealba TaxID=2878563 RepID=UPI001CD9EAF4|nr:hypothetical protein [Nocardia rosealba]MCA2210296.1 hypothetical protein [Nocardia rosealba]
MVETVDGVLDAGAARGLGFFTELTPRYLRAFPTAQTMSLQAIYATYDAERQLNLQTLAATVASLQLSLNAAKMQSDKQKQVGLVLPASWQGEAGTRGAEIVTGLATQSATDCTAVQRVLDALNTASTTILQTVKDKVSVIDGALVDGKVEVGGLTPTDIDEVIDGKATGEMDKAVWQKMLPGAIFPKKYPDQIKIACERWLQDTFAFKYDQMLSSFTSACTIARTAIEGKYDLITAALDAVEEKSYNSAKSVGGANDDDEKAGPGDKSTATEDQSKKTTDQSKGTGGDTSTAGTQNGDTSGSTTKTTTTQTPQTTTDDNDDSDTNSALSTLASTLSELGTTVSSALTGDLGDTLTSAVESAGTSLSDGIEQMTEQASSLLSGEHEASFQLGDTKVTIEAGANGLALTTTDANGTTNEYRLSLDENGIPVLTTDTSTKDESAETGAVQAEEGAVGSGTPESGVGHGAAGLEDAGSGVGGAADPTTAETPDLTDAPVTSEIGSGEPSSGSVAGGVPVGPRSDRQETDGEHIPTVENHPAGDAGDSGAVLAEAGPL